MKKENNKKKRSKKSFSIFLKLLLAVFLILLILSVIKTCRNCQNQNNRKISIIERTGYLPEDENWDDIPDVIPPYDEHDLDSLAEKVSLEAFFPPIGNQGQFGTCVAWAVGYNLKTALNAIENHWDTAQIAELSNQTSPKDLWMGIPLNKKRKPCSHTFFEIAFKVLMEQGVANMEKAPYQDRGSCDHTFNGAFIGDVTNKIASFSHVIDSSGGPPSVKQLKAYLRDTIPLAISAHLGNAFDRWNSEDVLTMDNFNKDAYHAMVLTGYDDNKNAFRVRNSWGKDWGDNGSIWVDYDFFMNGFCEAVFLATNH